MDAPPARLPPHSPEAEQSVLGSMVRDNGTIDDVRAVLAEERFYTDANRKIFAAILALHERQSPVDLVTLGEELAQRKQVEGIGGYGYLAQIFDATPAAANAVYYANIVRDKWMLRSLIHAGTEIIRSAQSPTGPAQEMAAEAARKLCGLESHDASQTCTATEAVDATMDLIDRIYTQGERGIMTGLRDIDAMTGGLHAGELILVGARPSVGKSMYGLHIARHCLKSGRPVLFVSLEMCREELMLRLAAAEGSVNTHPVRSGTASDARLESVRAALNEVRQWPLSIDDATGQTCSRILANARKVQRQQGLDLLVIDYLGLIVSEGRNQNREQEVAGISVRLKQMARELKIPVLCLAQLNRGPEHRADGEPKLSDFRDSGSQEQDPDTVMMLWRDQQFPNVVNVKIAKQRNGPVGTRKILACPDIQRFENYAGS